MDGFKLTLILTFFAFNFISIEAKAREKLQDDNITAVLTADEKPITEQTPIADAVEKPMEYAGAQLWKVDVSEQRHLAFISKMSHRRVFSVWGGNHTTVDILVLKEDLDNLTNLFKEEGIRYYVLLGDVQEAIKEENPPLNEEQIELQNRKGHRLTWQQYHRLADIYGFLDYLGTTYPNHCTVKTIGTTHKGRPIKLIKISNGNPGNKAVFIDSGIHAREWISPATATYIINHLAENFDIEDSEIQSKDWYFVPVLNPDGYEYTHTVDRLWRKNRKQTGVCSGVDLNRNFGFYWGGKGASKNPCGETFAGRKAFSENESKALADFILNSGVDFKAYISYHSYGQYILHPWGYDSVLPPDHKDLTRVGLEMAKAIKKTGGSEYRVGASSILLYPAAGGSDDWAKGVAKIKYSYTVELSDTGKHGFILPAGYIMPVAKESLAGLRVLAKAIDEER